MWGTPVFLSRVMLTSSRGLVTEATWSSGTPNEASLKNLLRVESVSEGAPAGSASYGPSWSALCSGRVPSARCARIWARVALPFSPGGRMSLHWLLQ